MVSELISIYFQISVDNVITLAHTPNQVEAQRFGTTGDDRHYG